MKRANLAPKMGPNGCDKQIRTEKHSIPPGFTLPEENTYGEMAPYTKPATTKRNL